MEKFSGSQARVAAAKGVHIGLNAPAMELRDWRGGIEPSSPFRSGSGPTERLSLSTEFVRCPRSFFAPLQRRTTKVL